ncbi:hypothetical protein COLO4_22308 [Corchorus olitorius]|uniref:RNase H type-1 domain-containing protein n=1 Tax=Corchorus olitorius TaxID=93759 RepID=A0A1R3IMY0_9ROSI|nr:hypothetical protein COLO4_22308 [Corchorus olitorius]
MATWFDPADATTIRNTPLSYYGASDVLIWHEDSLGKFSVRSGYLVTRRILGHTVRFRAERLSIWQLLWKSKIYHTLFDCPYSRKVWSDVGIWMLDIDLNFSDSPIDYWIEFFRRAHEHNSLDLCLSVLSEIWRNRNGCFHQTVFFHYKVQRWTAPPPGIVKINVDAAFQAATCSATLAMVARGSNGEIMMCATLKMDNVPSALHVELMAIHLGLGEAREAGYGRIVLESDSSLAVNEVNKPSDSLHEWRVVVVDIQFIISEFMSSYVVPIRRMPNFFSHELAKIDCIVGEKKVWKQSLPLGYCNPDI